MQVKYEKNLKCDLEVIIGNGDDAHVIVVEGKLDLAPSWTESDKAMAQSLRYAIGGHVKQSTDKGGRCFLFDG